MAAPHPIPLPRGARGERGCSLAPRPSGAALLFALLLASTPQVWPQSGSRAQDELASLLVAAGAALEAGDLEEAERGFDVAVREAPGDPRPWIGLCEIEALRNRPVPALEHCRKARELAPQAPFPALRVGQLLAQIGARDEALTALAEARKLDPSQASAYLAPALLLREAGRHEEAVQLLEQGMARATPQPELPEELCYILLFQGKLNRVREVAEQALERWPERGGLKLALGLGLSDQPASRERVVELLSQGLEQGAPDEGRGRVELGRVLLDLERYAEAITELRKALRLVPEEPEAHYRLGLALRATGDTEGARQALSRYRELTQSRGAQDGKAEGVVKALNEAHQLALGNQLLSAVERLDSVLSEHPDEPRAHALRARVLGALGRESEALESARRARAGAPQDADNQYLEGLFLVRSGEIEAGEARLRQAIALDPKQAEAHELLGVLASNAGRHEVAVQHLRQALEHGEDTPVLRRHLAQALSNAGLADEAQAVLEAAPKPRP